MTLSPEAKARLLAAATATVAHRAVNEALDDLAQPHRSAAAAVACAGARKTSKVVPFITGGPKALRGCRDTLETTRSD
jgi:hypothetical protein